MTKYKRRAQRNHKRQEADTIREAVKDKAAAIMQSFVIAGAAELVEAHGFSREQAAAWATATLKRSIKILRVAQEPGTYDRMVAAAVERVKNEQTTH